jgi:hypothetical protein
MSSYIVTAIAVTAIAVTDIAVASPSPGAVTKSHRRAVARAITIGEPELSPPESQSHHQSHHKSHHQPEAARARARARIVALDFGSSEGRMGHGRYFKNISINT